MAKQILISINNGKGSTELINGNYAVRANIQGYDNTSILPSNQEITEGLNEYSFTISANGTLTVHVTDNGTETGNPIVGAVLYRTDSTGNRYGEAKITNEQGNAVFNNVPFLADGSGPIIYYIQTESDGQHIFPTEVQQATLQAETGTIELANALAPERTLNITDANYSGLPITDGEITLTSN